MIPKTIVELLATGRVPHTLPVATYENYYWNKTNDIIEEFDIRKRLTDANIWALITKEWVDRLAQELKKRGCEQGLEVFGGTGLLSRELSSQGLKMACTDDMSWFEVRPGAKKFYQVDKKKANVAIQEYDYDFLVMSWPPYEYEDYKLITDKPIVYVGEYGGCTGSEKFWQKTEIEIEIEIPHFCGIRDKLYILKPKKNEL